MYRKFRNQITEHFINIPGYRTNRKIIVFESDDWGSIRMPSLNVYKYLIDNNILSLGNVFGKYDTLASEDDLSKLFELLLSYKDKNGNNPVFTANCTVANPNFHRIKESDFQSYFHEPFTDTLSRYPKHNRSFDFWKSGIENNIFYPQFHGREHINISRWLKKLKSGDKRYLEAFNKETFVVGTSAKKNKSENLAAALDYDDQADIMNVTKSITEGLMLFKDIFGFASKSFIAPNYIWDNSIEEVLAANKVLFIQGSKFQNRPNINNNSYVRKYRYTGKVNKFGQIQIVRNAFFEPSLMGHRDVISSCLRQIRTAFLFKKPAVISTHRLNYIGFLHTKNRDENLLKLRNLLVEILKRWPDVEFASSPQLGNSIINNY